MDIKKCLKLNYKLGRNFIIFPTNDGWTLIRTGSYRVVMSSKDSSDEDLDKFVKEHRDYNTLVIVRRYTLIANTIILGLCIANLFIHSSLLSYFNFGALMILLPLLIIINYIGASNHDTYQMVLDEDIAYYSKILAQEETKKRKSTRAKKEKEPSEVQK